MRNGGRIAAAIDVLNDVLTRHQPVKSAARDWGKRARYAGSKDRRAVREQTVIHALVGLKQRVERI